MVRVLIQDSESLYGYSMRRYLEKLFREKYQMRCVFMAGMTADNIQLADIIVLSFCAGEARVCFPQMRYRTKGIIFGTSESYDFAHGRLPSCFNDITFISLFAPLPGIERIISKKWDEYRNAPVTRPVNNCAVCSHKVLTQQQVRIMAEIYKGKTPATIAEDLDITQKTVFTHKYQMMNKFGLTTDFELIRFLHKLVSKNYQTNGFRGSVCNRTEVGGSVQACQRGPGEQFQ